MPVKDTKAKIIQKEMAKVWIPKILCYNITKINLYFPVFSLFTVVNFKNEPCQSTDSLSSGSTPYRNGTCFTSSECQSKGGSSKGGCAAGWIKIYFLKRFLKSLSFHLVLVFVVFLSSMIQAQLPSARMTPTSKIQGIQVNMERPILCLTLSTNVLMTFVGSDWILRLLIQWLQQILQKEMLQHQNHMLAMILWQSLPLQANPFQNFVEIWLDNTVWTL